MIRRLAIVLMVSALGLGGCSRLFHNYSKVMDTMADLPNGGEILWWFETQRDWPGKTHTKGPQVVWKRPGQPDKELTTLMPAPGTQPRRIPPNPDEVTTLVSEDGNRVSLLDDKSVFASFDYVTGVAILSRSGQPDWATAHREE